jgi:outer membrane protein assembly factor BamE
MTTLHHRVPELLRVTLIVLALALPQAGCVYRVDVQQGNLLTAADIDGVQAGMTRSQVRFLLGTPVVEDAFHRDRWDYVYYLRKGSSRKAEKRWLIVIFADDKVKEIRREVPFADGS